MLWITIAWPLNHLLPWLSFKLAHLLGISRWSNLSLVVNLILLPLPVILDSRMKSTKDRELVFCVLCFVMLRAHFWHSVLNKHNKAHPGWRRSHLLYFNTTKQQVQRSRPLGWLEITLGNEALITIHIKKKSCLKCISTYTRKAPMEISMNGNNLHPEDNWLLKGGLIPTITLL